MRIRRRQRKIDCYFFTLIGFMYCATNSLLTVWTVYSIASLVFCLILGNTSESKTAFIEVWMALLAAKSIVFLISWPSIVRKIFMVIKKNSEKTSAHGIARTIPSVRIWP